MTIIIFVNTSSFIVFQCLGIKEEELQERTVDRVDILTDPVDEKHYKKEEVRITIPFTHVKSVFQQSLTSRP